MATKDFPLFGDMTQMQSPLRETSDSHGQARQLIQVNGSAFDIPLYVQVAMNDQCECELSVDHQSLSYSQVLYKALHRLFFPPETQQT